jgi:hypothetical protein
MTLVFQRYICAVPEYFCSQSKAHAIFLNSCFDCFYTISGHFVQACATPCDVVGDERDVALNSHKKSMQTLAGQDMAERK